MTVTTQRRIMPAWATYTTSMRETDWVARIAPRAERRPLGMRERLTFTWRTARAAVQPRFHEESGDPGRRVVEAWSLVAWNDDDDA